MKKIASLLIVFVLMFACVLSLNVNVGAKGGGSDVTTIAGAQIRTISPAGIKFSGKVTVSYTDADTFGFILSRGSFDKNQLLALYDEGKAIAVDAGRPDADGYFYVSIVNIPGESYADDICALAYKESSGVKTYAGAAYSRNIYEVATAYKKDASYVENDFVEGIVNDGKITAMLYCGPITSYHDAMVTNFLADFNTFAGKSISDPKKFFDNTYKGDGTSLGYTFLTSAAYSAKWGWVLDYINEVRIERGAAALTDASAQAEARGEIHDFLNLCNKGEKGGNSSYGSNYSDRTDYRYRIEIKEADDAGLSYTCPGYRIDGWYRDTTFEGEYAVSLDSNGDYYAKYTKLDYTIDFYDGANHLDLGPGTYDYYDEFNLPSYEKSGYRFEGWYENSEFTGNPVTKLEKHSTGNKAYYAKMAEITGYTVTVNLNGGNTKYATEDAMIDAFVSAYRTYYNKPDAERANWSTKMEGVCGAATWHYDDFFKANPEWNWFLEFVCAMDDNWSIEVADGEAKYVWRMGLQAYFTKTVRSDWPKVSGDTHFVKHDVDYKTYLSSAEKTEYVDNKGTVVISSIIPNVYKEGYNFDGWYDNEGCTGSPITEVSEACTIYAKWSLVA